MARKHGETSAASPTSPKKPKTPGIRVSSTKQKPVATKLYDRDTGEWIATVRWRPCGEMYYELAKHVQKAVVSE